jgi:hypothetical protein
MKWSIAALFASFVFVPICVSAQEVVPIGSIAQVSDRSPSDWAYSGYPILRIVKNDGAQTPIMRTETYDARLVEILSRAQVPPIRAQDVRSITQNGHHYIIVRRYLLIEVMPQDARAAGTSIEALGRTWAATAGRVLPKIAPQPSPFGI